MKKTRTLTLAGLLAAQALTVWVIEAQLPPLTAIPGIKPGLANCFTLPSLCLIGPYWTLAVLAVRILIGNMVTGGLMSLAYSAAGAVCSYVVMLLLRPFFGERRLWVVSVFGALSHAIAQTAVAIAVTQTKEIVYYLPVMAVSAILTGSFTGVLSRLVLSRLRKLRFIREDQ